MSVLAAWVVAAACVWPLATPAGASRPRFVRATAVADRGIDESTAYHVSSAHDGFVTGGTERPPLSPRWSADLGGDLSYPLVTGGRVFVTGTPDGESSTSLFALDAATGQPAWGPTEVGSSVGITAGDGLVYVLTSNGFVEAFHQDTGDPAWTNEITDQYSFSSAPTYRNGMVYTGAAGVGGNVYAFNALNGDLVWEQGVENGDDSSPAVTDSGVYVAYACTQDYDFRPANGALVWHHNTGCEGGGGTTPAIGAGKLWEADWASGPAVLDAATGTVVGSYPGGPTPAFDGSTGFFLDGSVLKALNTTTMSTLWSTAGDHSFVTAPVVSDGYVWEGSSSGLLSAVDETTGTTAWSANVGAPVAGSGSGSYGDIGIGQGLVVVPTTDGHLVALGSQTNAFTPLTPARILDTRSTVQLGWTGPEPGAGATVNMQVDGVGGVPSSDVSAVALTLTGTDAEGAGYVTAWPTGTTRPLASNLNLAGPGQTMANSVVVPVGAGGEVSLYTQSGANLIADVAGYFSPATTATAGRFVPVAPARLLDTRPPPTGLTPGGTPVPGGTTVSLAVAGHGGVPAGALSAVALSVTATDTGGAGFVTAWPSGSTRPLASNLNFDHAGQTVADAVTVAVGPDGKVDLFNSSTTDLVVDVSGYYTDSSATSTASGLFVSTTPTRLLDTRTGGPQVGYVGPSPVVASSTVDAVLAGRTPVPAAGVSAVTANLTMTDTAAPGFLTVWPDGQSRPATSSLNVDVAGETLAGRVTVGIGSGGGVDLVSNVGTDAILDVSGYYTS